MGHNEDNGGRILTAQHWVPAATHKAGEMIKFEEAAASIPQVEKTFGFFWSQTFDPTGASFSDGFVNENGVTIVTNACTGIYKDDIMQTKDGGIGYGIRRLMAERATSARPVSYTHLLSPSKRALSVIVSLAFSRLSSSAFIMASCAAGVMRSASNAAVMKSRPAACAS